MQAVAQTSSPYETEAFTAENLSAVPAQAGVEHAERGSRVE